MFAFTAFTYIAILATSTQVALSRIVRAGGSVGNTVLLHCFLICGSTNSTSKKLPRSRLEGRRQGRQGRRKIENVGPERAVAKNRWRLEMSEQRAQVTSGTPSEGQCDKGRPGTTRDDQQRAGMQESQISPPFLLAQTDVVLARLSRETERQKEAIDMAQIPGKEKKKKTKFQSSIPEMRHRKSHCPPTVQCPQCPGTPASCEQPRFLLEQD